MKATLLQAATWMAPALGLKMPRDKSEVIENVNRYRNLLYTSYDDFRLFDDYEVCLPLQKYQMNCDGDPCSYYYGITLPLDMCGVVSAWEMREPLKLRSHWREARVGKQVQTGKLIEELIPVNGTFPTERELTTTSSLRAYAHDSRDEGKIMMVTIVTTTGEHKNLEYTLSNNADVIIDYPVCSILSVCLPSDQCGMIDLIQDSGDYILSRYYPGAQLPCYRRYKVMLPCPSGCLLVQGNREYMPICEDHDVVEIGDQLAIEAAGRYFRYYESLDDKEIRRSQIDEKTMIDRIEGVIARKRGRNHQDGSLFASPVESRRKRRRRGLPGYNRLRR